LRVTGVYAGPRPNLRGPPEGDFLPGYGLEAWPTSAFDSQPSLSLWRFDADLQNWQTKVSLPDLTFSDLPAMLAPHEAVYTQAPAPVDLEVPVPALSLRFYHQDHIGSSSVMSDAAGALVEESASLPFGFSRTEFRPRGIREDYRFTQKERDSESGLDYFEARFLLSSCGRFTRVDPLATTLPPGWLSNPQRLDPYSYCGNRPLIATDPSGKSWITKAVKLAIKGGDIAATFADLADNAATVFDSNASVLDRVVAGASIASELLPVSIGDAKDAYRGARWAVNKIDDAGDAARAAHKADAVTDATKVAGKPDFIVTERGTVVPVSQSRMREGFDNAGFPSKATRAPGIEHTMPDGRKVRTMEASGDAPRRASFENANGGPVTPDGSVPQPPRGATKSERKDFVRDRTHVEQSE
jgi:RHS repeat-associated protein